MTRYLLVFYLIWYISQYFSQRIFKLINILYEFQTQTSQKLLESELDEEREINSYDKDYKNRKNT